MLFELRRMKRSREIYYPEDSNSIFWINLNLPQTTRPVR